MIIPKIIRFKSDQEKFLSERLLANAPYEGCALLIGQEIFFSDQEETIIYEVNHIWTCRNVWEPNKFNLNETANDSEYESHMPPSKVNRYLIDPKDQFQAQRWARSKKWKILGSAHSHPSSNNTPSVLDINWANPPCLCVIATKHGQLKAWWIDENKDLHEIKVIYTIESK